MKNKHTIAGGLLLALLGLTVAPMVVSAQGAGMLRSYCDRLSTLEERTLARIETREERVSERVARMEALDEARAERAADMAAKREAADAAREARYEALTGKVNGEALAEFQQAVEAAVAERREKIDQALQDYRDGVDALVGTDPADVEGALSDLKTAVTEAFADAEATCESNERGLAQTALREALMSANQAFREVVTRDSDVAREEHQALREAKRTAIDEAVQEFKAAVRVAAEALKVAS